MCNSTSNSMRCSVEYLNDLILIVNFWKRGDLQVHAYIRCLSNSPILCDCEQAFLKIISTPPPQKKKTKSLIRKEIKKSPITLVGIIQKNVFHVYTSPLTRWKRTN